ncbi:MAG: hypothetical protein KGJ89_03430 [Patescibacteria group bacterium]|nr:hypothetical protein [Patescibacteria group bacterium]MDE2226983.1 hypothetical protein [Patescibacteria group bacterium]
MTQFASGSAAEALRERKAAGKRLKKEAKRMVKFKPPSPAKIEIMARAYGISSPEMRSLMATAIRAEAEAILQFVRSW